MKYSFAFFILIGIASIIYLISNRSNPYTLQIILGTVAIGVIIGIVSTLVTTYLSALIKENPKTAIMISCCVLVFFIAILIYTSNDPKPISYKIPVTYIVDQRLKEMPLYLAMPDTHGSPCYWDARNIFNKYKDKSPENKKIIDEIINKPFEGTVKPYVFFQNLTEYLIPYAITPIVYKDLDEDTYYQETSRGLGFPDKKIKGEDKYLEDINGDIKSNLFLGYTGMISTMKIEMRMPKDTIITLRRQSPLISKFIIKNKYLEITIGIQYKMGSTNMFAFLYPNDFPAYLKDKMEFKFAYKRFDTVIYYDVKFSKWRHGFSSMKYYEQWANDLLNVLKEKFEWGSQNLHQWPIQ